MGPVPQVPRRAARNDERSCAGGRCLWRAAAVFVIDLGGLHDRCARPVIPLADLWPEATAFELAAPEIFRRFDCLALHERVDFVLSSKRLT